MNRTDQGSDSIIMNMSTVRARYDGRVFVPETPIQLPVGEVVEVNYRDNSSSLEPGTAAAILHVLDTMPKVSAEDVAEMERHIEEGMSKTDFRGVFDDLADSSEASGNGT